MKKISLIISVILLFSLIFVVAHGEETFLEAEHMIEEQIPCEDLTEEQLELIGDYFMEQMHPGEAHEVMDEMMGGEGSESLRLMHINMAESFYCGEHEATSGGMMGGSMMGSGGMMNMMTGYSVYDNSRSYNWLFSLALVLIILLLVVLIVKQIQKK